jgi:RNA polymerase sigma factor (sigma-70 family)
MPAAQAGAILRHVHRLAGGPAVAGHTDGELLARFAGPRDEAAFGELLRRHGPMVWCVCRRLLPDVYEAEDAFQATFLVLVRRAGSVWVGTSLAGFLHGVAYRVAVRMRRQSRLRPAAGVADGVSGSDVVSEASLRELWALLDEEVHRLPAKYRAPFVLCCLEGKSREAAAGELGLKDGTLSSRLAQARNLLRQRLVRRGLTPAAALAAAETARGTMTTAVPATLLEVTSRTALLTVSGGTAVMSGAAAVAADGVLRAMRLAPLKVIVGLVLAVALACVGVAAVTPAVGAEKTNPVAAGQSPPAPAAGAARVAGVDRYGDPLPQGALARLGTLRFRHGYFVNALAYSPDGKLLASAGTGRGLCLWDAVTGQLVHELAEVPVQVHALAFSPDGRWLAAPDGESHLCLWDVATARQVRQLAGNVSSGPIGLAFSPDGTRVAASTDGRAVCVWDVATGKTICKLDGHDGNVLAIAFSPDGRLLATSDGRVVRLWDAARGTPQGALTGHTDRVWSLAFAPAGARGRTGTPLLASGGMDQTVRLWDVARHKQLRVLGESLGPVWAVAFAPDGRTLATGHASADGRTYLWDVATGKELRHIATGAMRVQALAFSPNGDTLATSGPIVSAIRRWDPATGRERQPLAGPRGTPYRLAFADDGRSLFVASHDHTLRRWDWARDSEETLLSWDNRAAWDTAVAIGPARAMAAGYDFEARTIRVWGPDPGAEPRTLGERRETVWALAFSPDGRYLLSGSDRTIRLWDVWAGKELRRIEDLDDGVKVLAFSPDGRTFASGRWNRAGGGLLRGPGLRLWETATGKVVRSWDGHNAAYWVEFSPDGSLLAFAERVPSVALRLWDLAAGKEIPQPVAPTGRWMGAAMAFSPDDKLLAVGVEGRDSPVALVEIATGQEVRRLAGHSGGVRSIAFSADGKRLATGGGDFNVVLWDLTGKSPADLDRCWSDLAGPDAAKAHAALRDLASVPSRSVPYLRPRLRPAAPLDDAARRELRRWLVDLDSDDFTVRRRAAERLAQLGDLAVPELNAALGRHPTAEARRQLEILLGSATSWTPPRLRVSRAVSALELAGTPEARRLLEDLAGGATEALVTREAKAALDRLARRPQKP